tara:strand:+ start:348 stop:2189 length:1842 start_codon:yes stop_codon:yes gene_type:complete
MRVLGISAFYHDSAAAIVEDGLVLAAAQEERFTRVKQDSRFPKFAIRSCLDQMNISLDDLDAIAFYDKPHRKFARLLSTYVSCAPAGLKSFMQAIPLWMEDRMHQREQVLDGLSNLGLGDTNKHKNLAFLEHHQSHAASAFYPSPYETAAVLTLDGVGEWATTTIALGVGNKLEIQKEIHFPHSVGLLYSAFTYYLGFKVNSGEYKVMGLAPYGEPKYTGKIFKDLVDLKEDGSFRLNQKYFDYSTGLRMINQYFEELFSSPARTPETLLTPFHMDIAASIQVACEEIVLRIVRHIKKETKLSNLCLAGGVALNCVANGRILNEGLFDSIWVQPAAGDAGGALGAALGAYYSISGAERSTPPSGGDSMSGSMLGPEFSNSQIQTELDQAGAVYEFMSEDNLIEFTAKSISDGAAVGWFQGRMEFGPRALGGRSILADPRSADTQKTLNLKVKYRESFRPFAPSILTEDTNEWFDLNADSPYMLIVAPLKTNLRRAMTEQENQLFGIDKLNIHRSKIPAVTHVDYSARVQTVSRDTHPLYYKLIEAFKAQTGCPILVNTSFNIRGEPIVCTPSDAFKCFMGTDLDLLVIGNYILNKSVQNSDLRINYTKSFDLD